MIAGWHVTLAAGVVGWVSWELGHPPVHPKGCVDTCFGNLPLLLTVGLPCVVALAISTGISPGMLTRRYNRDEHTRNRSVVLALRTAALATLIAVTGTAVVAGLLLALARLRS